MAGVWPWTIDWSRAQARPVEGGPGAGAVDGVSLAAPLRERFDALADVLVPGAGAAGAGAFLERALREEAAPLRSTFAAGLGALEAASIARFGAPFVAVEPGDRRRLVESLEAGDVAGLGAWPAAARSPEAFFLAARRQAILAYLSDPAHGGNLHGAGWRALGYPGPGHDGGGYEAEVLAGKRPAPPQPISRVPR